MKILLGDFNAKMGREVIFELKIWNEGLHQERNDNGARIVNFTTSKVWMLRAKCSYTAKFISTPRALLMGRHTTRLITY
jgi:hypothetical protein